VLIYIATKFLAPIPLISLGIDDFLFQLPPKSTNSSRRNFSKRCEPAKAGHCPASGSNFQRHRPAPPALAHPQPSISSASPLPPLNARVSTPLDHSSLAPSPAPPPHSIPALPHQPPVPPPLVSATPHPKPATLPPSIPPLPRTAPHRCTNCLATRTHQGLAPPLLR
jgi:hypothetical protein